MVRHYIIMSSSYSDGTRIAYDITDKSLINSKFISGIIDHIIYVAGCDEDIPLSTHFIEAETDSWESVKASDPFFESVVCIKSLDEFAEKIKKDRVLSGLDVANYILSRIKCTHLSLEKLVYLAYADYLCSHSERLFEDNIYAFRHGPVIESVYSMYKRSGYTYVEPMEYDKDAKYVSNNVKAAPVKSRILFAKNGFDKVQSIEKTIKKYGHYSAGELVEITHRDGSPWSRVDSSRDYQVIPDELIKKYHYIESV